MLASHNELITFPCLLCLQVQELVSGRLWCYPEAALQPVHEDNVPHELRHPPSPGENTCNQQLAHWQLHQQLCWCRCLWFQRAARATAAAYSPTQRAQRNPNTTSWSCSLLANRILPTTTSTRSA
jgi:hypothetical protein